MLPGTSGISLKVDEWRALCAALPDIIQADQAEGYDYCLQLAPLRKAAFSTYKWVACRRWHCRCFGMSHAEVVRAAVVPCPVTCIAAGGGCSQCWYSSRPC